MGTGPRSRRRALVVACGGVAATVLSALAFTPLRDKRGIGLAVLCLSAAAAGTTALGGLAAGLITVVAGGLCLNYLYFPPVYTFRLIEREWLTLVVYVSLTALVCLAVHTVRVNLDRQRRREAEEMALARSAEALLRADDLPAALRAVLGEAMATTGATAGVIEVRDTTGWRTVAESGALRSPGVVIPFGDSATEARLVLAGTLEQPVLAGFAAQASLALDRDRLRAIEVSARVLAEEQRMRREFLSAVSHDLRTPLTAIQVSASALTSPELQLDQAGLRELASTIAEEAERLDRMVRSLLDLSKLEGNALQPRLEAVHPDDLLAAAADRARAGGTPVFVDAGRGAPVIADRHLAARVLDNLVVNAAKFAPDSSIELIADGAEVRVVDRGPGISPRHRDRMFDRFYQGGRDVGEGSGLGLAICRGIMEAQGGTIDYEPTPGGGATFRCRFQLAGEGSR